MFFIIYKITNKINGKIYIGSHKTSDINDDYMGSGKYLKHAYDKYGMENFNKEILFVYDNPFDMYAKEAELVNEEFLSEENTYNLKIGGFGGFDYINLNGKNLYGKNGQLGYGGDNLNKRSTKDILIERGTYDQTRQKMSLVKKEAYKSGELIPPFLGKLHSDTAKQKIGEKNSVHQKGEGNSQFGTCWMTHPDFGNKKVKKDKIDEYVSLGFIRGRKIKRNI